MSWTHHLGNLFGRGDIQRAGRAEVKTFFVEAAVDHINAVGIWDMDGIIEQINVWLQVVGDAALTNTLCDAAALSLRHLAAGLDVAMENTARRIGNDTLDATIAYGFEVSRDASDGASSATCTSESVNFTASLIPDFGTSGLDVGATISNIVELVGPDGVFEAFGVSASLVVVVFRILKGDGRHGIDFGAEQSQEIDLALGLGVGHVNDQLVALGAADVCQTDARVAGGTFDDSATGLQQAAFLGILDDIEGSAILNTATRILKLGLTQNFTSSFVREAFQADKGSVSNG